MLRTAAHAPNFEAVAARVLSEAPHGALSDEHKEALANSDVSKWFGVATNLLAGGHPGLAEPLYRALSRLPEYAARSAAGLARVAEGIGDLDAAALSWRDAFAQFDDWAEPYWYLERSQVEAKLGRISDARDRLIVCRQRFAEFAPAAAAFANLLGRHGSPREAVAAWKGVLAQFSGEARAWWFPSFAAALRAGNEPDEAEQVLDEMAARFPDAAPSLARRAHIAMRGEDWGGALGLWTVGLEEGGEPARPEALNGRAQCLFRLGRIPEALADWRALLARFAHFDFGHVSAAAAAQELGETDDALEILDRLIARSPAQLRPEWLAARAECLMALQRYVETGEAVADLKRRFPEAPSGWVLGHRLAETLREEGAVQFEIIAEARRLFPDHGDIMQRYVAAALVSGRLGEAVAAVAKLADDPADHCACLARWRVVWQRDGIAALRALVLSAVERGGWTLMGGLALGEFVLGLATDWSAAAAARIFADLDSRYSSRPAVVCGLARAMIEQGRDAEALALADAVAPEFRTSGVLEVKAWADHARGDEAAAKRRWRAILEAGYAPAVHAPAPKLTLRREAEVKGGVTAYLAVRNERRMLPSFLKHHRALGVRRFVCVDNGSRDGALEYLKRQPDVTLYETGDHFGAAGSGMRWINALIERHDEGGWRLFVDVDERFVYPGWEHCGLDGLLAYLDAEGADGVAAFMLDTFAPRLFDAAGRPASPSRHDMYDADYVWLGHSRPPWRKPVGGVRGRLFGVQELLHKIPLTRAGAAIYVNNHETTPLRLSGVTGALLHYKLLSLAYRWDGDARALGEDSPTRIPETMRRYKRYGEIFAGLHDSDLRAPGASRRLGGSLELADSGLMQAPAAFRRWLQRAPSLSKDGKLDERG